MVPSLIITSPNKKITSDFSQIVFYFLKTHANFYVLFVTFFKVLHKRVGRNKQQRSNNQEQPRSF